MDAGPLTYGPKRPWRPEGCDRVGLLLQGGGALGAYQAGVYQALHEAGLQPDWLAGVSIGSVNAALIAGNPPERRLAALEDFWRTVTLRPVWGFLPDGDGPRKVHNLWSSFMTMALGQPGLFAPNLPSPWMRPRGATGATSYYDSAPLRETLLRLVDFDRINQGEIRFAVGAVNVASGNFAYFDNAETTITPDHIMASGALPPALPMTQIAGENFWDGGIVSNTPLQHLLDHIDGENALVFQVDLFSARGPVPRDMPEAMGRAKDIQYSSRTRLTTDYYRQAHAQRIQIKRLLEKLPDDQLSDEERVLKLRLATLPAINIMQLIYQQAAHEGEAKDYDFSKSSMRDHWASGLRDTRATLARRDWLEMPSEESGIITHDIHRTGV
ncbi:patatin-like phospholipase family protein [Acidisphaera sp. L21]|uniref:patatin-like phospholipase family protein n=1 Tax=Acidisphaera sp. L21 TaxID=1641851 RepID=UPI00131DB780|nr:patatin-like phospholipase family protein [Acidisphaera sp. L21]